MSVLSLFAKTATVGLSLLLAVAAPSFAEEAAGSFKDPSKIAAIGGSITEIVYALGEQDLLVAREFNELVP